MEVVTIVQEKRNDQIKIVENVEVCNICELVVACAIT